MVEHHSTIAMVVTATTLTPSTHTLTPEMLFLDFLHTNLKTVVNLDVDLALDRLFLCYDHHDL